MQKCSLCNKQVSLVISCLKCSKPTTLCDECDDDSLCKECSQPNQQEQQQQQQQQQQSEQEEQIVWGQRLDSEDKIIITQCFTIDNNGLQHQLVLELDESTIALKYAVNMGNRLMSLNFLEGICQLDNQRLLVSGGWDQQDICKTTSVIEYTRHNNQYYFRMQEQKSDMCQNRMSHKLMRLTSGDVLAIGGRHTNDLSSCEVYSVNQDQWTPVGNMSISRIQSSCFIYKQQIYVYGGFKSEQQVAEGIEKYIEQTNSWQYYPLDISQLNQQVVRSVPVVKDDHQVIIMGGSNGKAATNHILYLNMKDYSITKSTQSLQKNRVQGEGFYNEKDNSVMIVGGAYQESVLTGEVVELMDKGVVNRIDSIQNDMQAVNQYPHYIWLQLIQHF